MEYSYGAFQEDIYSITERIKATGRQYDEIIALARGGAVPGVVLSHKLGVPLRIIDWSFQDGGRQDWLQLDLIQYKLGQGKQFLIVEDILDSGKTLSTLYDALGLAYGTKQGFLSCHLAVLIRNVAIKEFIPDFVGREINREHEIDKGWVNFWWENK